MLFACLLALSIHDVSSPTYRDGWEVGGLEQRGSRVEDKFIVIVHRSE